MRCVLVVLIVMAIAGTAIAQNLDSSRDLPAKNTPSITYIPPVEAKQGGDTIGDATIIPSLPFAITGTTDGYLDDYDEICPYDTPGSPDVVYSFTPLSDLIVVVDLCGSSYDTKTYIYDEAMNLVACNDDYFFDEPCGQYVSKIDFVTLTGGTTYYIVIDGYGGDFGAYQLHVQEYIVCILDCRADAVLEGEPPLEDGYVDNFNSGCGSPEPGVDPYTYIDWINVAEGSPLDGLAWLCGTSGWYLSPDGNERRDTDWIIVNARETGLMEVTIDAEFPLYLFKLAPTDCASVGVDLLVQTLCGDPMSMTFPVTEGEEIWLWTGPTDFIGPAQEFTYIMTVSNNTFNVIPNEGMSWGKVKSLYR